MRACSPLPRSEYTRLPLLSSSHSHCRSTLRTPTRTELFPARVGRQLDYTFRSSLQWQRATVDLSPRRNAIHRRHLRPARVSGSLDGTNVIFSPLFQEFPT